MKTKVCKRVASLLMVTLIIVGLVSPVGFSAFRASMRVLASGELQEAKVGEKSVYSLTMKNVGNYTAHGLTVSFSGDHPFRADLTNLKKSVVNIAPNGQATVNFDVIPMPTAKTKIYAFDVVFSYKDENNNIVTNTEKAYIKIINNEIEPILSVVETSTNVATTTSNQVNSLNLKIRNDGTLTANQIKVTLSGMSAQGILLHNESDVKMIKSLTQGSYEVVNYQIIGGPSATGGTHNLTASIEYIDDLGNSYKKEHPVFLSVSTEEAAGIEIKNLSYPKQVNPDSDFILSYTLVNKTKKAINNLEASISYPEVFITKSNSKKTINLAAGESMKVDVLMMPKKDTSAETYHCYVNLNKIGDSDGKVIKREYVGIYVSGSETSASAKPKLIVSAYDYGKKADAGTEFELKATIKNTSTSMATQNIKIEFSNDSGVFTPVDSSNAVFIDRIGPGETKDVSIKMLTKLDAEVKIYAMSLKMSYEDGKGKSYDYNKNPYIETESLSISVTQPVRLEAGDIKILKPIAAGTPGNIEVDYYNMGRSTVYNLIIKVTGVEVTEKSYFVGNFDAGRSDVYSFNVIEPEAGEKNAKIVFEYEDALGRKSAFEKDIVVSVQEAQAPVVPEGGGDNMNPGDYNQPPQEEGGLSIWVKLGIGAAVLVALIVIIKVIRTKKRKRLEEMEDLDE